MRSLDDIAVRVESPRELTHNTVPLLHEVRHALQRLATTAEPTVIDLHAIPFAPGEVDTLLEFLGRGEISATLNAMGETRIWETAYPGAWVVDHYNTEEERIALHVEVCEVPALLRTPADDVRDSIVNLGEALAEIRDPAA